MGEAGDCWWARTATGGTEGGGDEAEAAGRGRGEGIWSGGEGSEREEGKGKSIFGKFMKFKGLRNCIR